MDSPTACIIYDNRMKLDTLKLWMDPIPRTGPEAMAVDEWLLVKFPEPILRIYEWQGEWGSLGYFDRLSDARKVIPDLEHWVRRWTGGGTVDHRQDWAYTLIIPGADKADRKLGGAESYRYIHAALADALKEEGLDAKLSCGNQMTGSKACFENPVSHDLVDSSGRKLAGAGQRRSKGGMMHQGSVALPLDNVEASRARAQRLAEGLTERSWKEINKSDVPASWLRDTVAGRYGNSEWTQRRP